MLFTIYDQYKANDMNEMLRKFFKMLITHAWLHFLKFSLSYQIFKVFSEHFIQG